MSSTIAILLPVSSLLYFFQTLLNKRQGKLQRRFIALPAFAMFLTDLFVFLVFYVNCYNASKYFRTVDCIGIIYPTLDFILMSLISAIVLLVSVYYFREWPRRKYFLAGSIIIYLGFALRIFLLTDAANALSILPDSSNPVVLEIFSIVITYGLISSIIYLSISCLSLFKLKTPHQPKG